MNEALRVVENRPKTIPIVAVFLFFATFIASIVGVSLLFPNRLLDWLWKLNPEGAVLFRSIGPVSGVFLLLLAVGTFAAARGLLAGHRWAWWFSVALFAFNAGGDVVSYFLIHDALRAATGSIISSAFLVALCRPAVRNCFLCRTLMLDRNP
jgi:hypothetical protein